MDTDGQLAVGAGFTAHELPDLAVGAETFPLRLADPPTPHPLISVIVISTM